MGFFEGMISSMVDRVRSQSWEDWQDDWFWMLGYFTLGVWYALITMTAPRLHIKQGPNKAISGPLVELPSFKDHLQWGLGVSTDNGGDSTTDLDSPRAT